MRLKVGTFNLAAGLGPDIQAMNRLITKLDLDIVGLQEVDRHSFRTKGDMLKQLANEDYPYIAFTRALTFSEGGEYGIGVLSKYPIVSEDSFAYNIYGDEPRVCQKLLIQTPIGIISFFNTHLSYETRVLRELQVNQLLGELEKTTYPFVLTGDFNFSDSLEEWSLFSDFQLANSAEQGWKETFAYHDQAMIRFEIDNVIISPQWSMMETMMSTRPLSDHRLLTATITLK